LKREVKKAYRKWRKGKEAKKKYLEKRRQFRELCERKERRRWEKLEKEVRKIKTEVWKIVNKERRKRTHLVESIDIGKWENHFCQLLQGCKEDRREKAEKRRLENDGEDEITDEEIERQIGRLEKKKAAGADEIGNEAWIYIVKNI